jgi:hypothetical protein
MDLESELVTFINEIPSHKVAAGEEQHATPDDTPVSKEQNKNRRKNENRRMRRKKKQHKQPRDIVRRAAMFGSAISRDVDLVHPELSSYASASNESTTIDDIAAAVESKLARDGLSGWSTSAGPDDTNNMKNQNQKHKEISNKSLRARYEEAFDAGLLSSNRPGAGAGAAAAGTTTRGLPCTSFRMPTPVIIHTDPARTGGLHGGPAALQTAVVVVSTVGAEAQQIFGQRRLVTTRDVKAGEIIYAETVPPVCVLPCDSMEELPGAAGTPINPLLPDPRRPLYEDLAPISSVALSPRTSVVSLAVRLLLMNGVGHAELVALGYTMETDRDAGTLHPDYECARCDVMIKDVGAWRRYALAPGASKGDVANGWGELDPSRAEVLCMLRTLHCYGKRLTIPGVSILERGFVLPELVIGVANYSCSPTARLMTGARDLHLVARHDLAAGTEVTIVRDEVMPQLDVTVRAAASYVTFGYVCHCPVCVDESHMLAQHIALVAQARGLTNPLHVSRGVDAEQSLAEKAAISPMMVAGIWRHLMKGDTSRDPPMPDFMNHVPCILPNTVNYEATYGDTTTGKNLVDKVNTARSIILKAMAELQPDQQADVLLAVLEDMGPVIVYNEPTSAFYLDPRLLWGLFSALAELIITADPEILMARWETPMMTAKYLMLLPPSDHLLIAGIPNGESLVMASFIESRARARYEQAEEQEEEQEEEQDEEPPVEPQEAEQETEQEATTQVSTREDTSSTDKQVTPAHDEPSLINQRQNNKKQHNHNKKQNNRRNNKKNRRLKHKRGFTQSPIHMGKHNVKMTTDLDKTHTHAMTPSQVFLSAMRRVQDWSKKVTATRQQASQHWLAPMGPLAETLHGVAVLTASGIRYQLVQKVVSDAKESTGLYRIAQSYIIETFAEFGSKITNGVVGMESLAHLSHVAAGAHMTYQIAMFMVQIADDPQWRADMAAEKLRRSNATTTTTTTQETAGAAGANKRET